MDKSDITRNQTATEVLDELGESQWVRPSLEEDWATLQARKMLRYPKEKLARQLYYDLFEFRVR